MKKSTFVKVLLGMVLCLLFPIAASALQFGTPTPKSLLTDALFPVGTQATVGNCSHLNVRKGAGNGYSAFTVLDKGDVITVLEYSNKWVKVDTAKGQGWVYAGYLLNDAVNTAAASAKTAASSGGASVGRPTPVGQITESMFPVNTQVTVDYCYFLNVRRGPDKSYAAFNAVAKGDQFTVLEYKQKWLKIDTSKGQGWIYAGYLSRDGAATSGAGTTGASASGAGTTGASASGTGTTGTSASGTADTAATGAGSTGASSVSATGSADYTLAQLNMAADVIYDSAMQQFETYEAYGIPVPDTAFSTLNQAYESYQSTINIAIQTGLSDDPAVAHARERMTIIRQIRGY